MPNFYQIMFAYLAAFLIVAWAVNRTPVKGRISAAIAFFGRHSYSIYLWHALVAVSMAKLAVHWFSFPAYAGTAIVLGVFMSKAVEFPALKVRDRLFPSILEQRRTQSDLRVITAPSVQKVKAPPLPPLGALTVIEKS